MNEIIESPLTESELELKAELEASIEEGLSSLERLARDLAEYRDLRLYRDEYASWEECVLKKWNMRRSRVQQLLAAAATSELVNELDIPDEYKTPSEGQLRPISKKKIPDEEKKQAYSAAVAESIETGKPLTGAMVEEKLHSIKGTSCEEAEPVAPQLSSCPVVAACNSDAVEDTQKEKDWRVAHSRKIEFLNTCMYQLRIAVVELQEANDPAIPADVFSKITHLAGAVLDTSGLLAKYTEE